MKITKVTALFGIPLVVLAIIYSRTILSFVYGEQYGAVAIPFGLLCVYVLLIIQAIILSNVFFALGQPEKHRLFVVSCVLILIILIYPAVKIFGLTGAALSVLTANFIALCFQVFAVHKTIGIKIRDYVFSWIPGLSFGTIIALLRLLIMLIGG